MDSEEVRMANSLRKKGMLLAALGATLWGVNGTFADIVFSQLNAPVEWVVGTRLSMAGLLILLYSRFILKEAIFSIFKQKSSLVQLLLFSLIGMVSCQYLFFLSIGINGAGLATILQFVSPIIIYLYLVMRREKVVYPREILYILMSVVGIILVVTKGNFAQLDVSVSGLLVGLGSAIGVAFYTLQPRQLLKEFGSPIVVGWGMLIGGGFFQFIHPIWRPGFEVDGKVVLYMAFIVIIGTALAFTLFLASINYIEPSLSNILAALEPLVANILTVLLLKQEWSFVQVTGIFIVLVSVILFANYGEKLKRLSVTMHTID